MAIVSYTDGEARELISGESKLVYWESPSTMDANDTVVVPTITGKSVRMVTAWDHTTGDAVTATISTSTITVDAAGGDTNNSYGLLFNYI